KIPVPVTSTVHGAVQDDFSTNAQQVFNQWNIYSPLWAPVAVEGDKLVLRDKDPFDYAKAERVVPVAQRIKIGFSITPEQADHGRLEIEFANLKGQAAGRLIFDSDGKLKNKAGYREAGVTEYQAGKKYDIVLNIDTETRSYTIQINGQDK